MSLLDEIRKDRKSGMDPKHGNWVWQGQPSDLSLATVNGGRRYVMDFVRKGMGGAQPRFQSRGSMHNAADHLVTFSVGDDFVRGDAMARSNSTVYRYDISGVDHPDARRIARVPQMEAALLAADELARFVDLVHGSFGGGLVVTFTDSDVEQAAAALTAYRAAIEAT